MRGRLSGRSQNLYSVWVVGYRCSLICFLLCFIVDAFFLCRCQAIPRHIPRTSGLKYLILLFCIRYLESSIILFRPLRFQRSLLQCILRCKYILVIIISNVAVYPIRSRVDSGTARSAFKVWRGALTRSFFERQSCRG